MNDVGVTRPWLDGHRSKSPSRAGRHSAAPDRPKGRVLVATTELNRARRQAGIGLAGLADRLVCSGWRVTSQDLFRWESEPDITLPAPVISALAGALDVPPRELCAEHPSGGNHGVHR